MKMMNKFRDDFLLQFIKDSWQASRLKKAHLVLSLLV